MKRTLNLVFALLLISACLIVPVRAATDQGFEWAIAPSDRFDYTLIAVDENGTILDEGLYFIVDTPLPTIPDSMDNWTDISYPDFNANWDNGTSIGFYGLIFLFAGNFFLPIGNWGLLTTLVDTRNGVGDVSNVVVGPNTAVYWGYTSEAQSSDENTSVLVNVGYTKSDGVLAWYTVQMWNVTSGIRQAYFSVYRDNLPYDEDLPATSQGLSWGIATGDKFNYTFELHDDTTNMTEGMTFEVGASIPPIPDQINVWSQIDYPEIDAQWLNGTTIGFWVFAIIPAGNFFLPIGNWTLMSSLVEERIDVFDLTLDATSATYWGYSFKMDGINPNETALVHVDFLKSDGGLAHYELEIVNSTTSETLVTASLIREGLPTTTGGFVLPTWITDNLLFIGIGVVVIIAVLIYIKKK
jgi:hypothetical protein